MAQMIDVKKLSTRQVKGKTLNVSGGKESERLGYVVLFTVGSVEVPHDEIKEWWKTQNVLFPEWMPKKATAFAAFQNTCSTENISLWQKVDAQVMEENKEFYKEKGVQVRTEYLVVRNPQNKDEYIFTRRVWMASTNKGEDAKEVTPEYPNIARLQFDNVNDQIVTEAFPNYKGSDVIIDIDRVANEEYQRQKKIVNGNRHRALIREVIESCGGIHMMGSGGTYFIPADGYDRLEKLSEYLDEVVSNYTTTGYKTAIMTLDAFDDKKMRARIQQDVETEVSKLYDELLDDTLVYLEDNAAKDSEKDQERITKALETRLASAGRIGALKGRYEALLGAKITVKKAMANAPEMTGRAKAVLSQMQKAAGVM